MIAINAHFDGKVIIPDEPLDLPPGQPLIVRIEAKDADASRESALAWLAGHASDSEDNPRDLAHEHDHYLYGASKRGV